MQSQAIVEKTPWWKNPTGRGMMVFALCLILLCVALAIGIAMILSKSSWRNAPDSDAEVLPSQPEAFVWKNVWRMLPKKVKTMRTIVQAWLDAQRPVTKQTERNKPKQDVAPTAATRPHEVGPVNKRTETTTHKQDAVTKGAALPDKIATPKPKNTTEFCETDKCRHLASQIVAKMDSNAKPCEDFYQYACGGFLNHTPIPKYREGVSTFTLAEDNLQMQLKNIIERSNGPDEPKSFKLVNTVYNSCTAGGINDSDAIIRSYSKFGNFKSVSKVSFIKYLFEFAVDADVENSTARAIYIDQVSLEPSRVFLINDDDQIPYYRQHMSMIAKVLNATEKEVDKQLDTALTFMKKLAEISLPEAELLDVTKYHRTTLGKFIEQYPDLSLMRTIFNIALSHTIGDNEVVIVKSEAYFSKLVTLISNTTDNERGSYVFWRITRSFASILHEKMNISANPYKQNVFGISAKHPKEQICMHYVARLLPLIVSAMYMKKNFDENVRKTFDEMLENYVNAMEETLKTPDGSYMKQIALQKHKTVRAVFRPTNKNMDMFEGLFKNLTLPEDDYGQTIQILLNGYNDYRMRKFQKSPLEFNWSPPRNAIFTHTCPLASYNHLLFSNDQPTYLNYGALGFHMSREFAHAFDNNGRHYDKNGNIVKVVNKTIDEIYENISDCIIAKYSNYSINGTNLTANAVTMQNENFADMAGLKIAYFMYEKWIAKNGDERKLPNINENTKQLFWISAAQTLCSKYNPEAEIYKIKTEAYFPDRFRVLGAMSNMPEFSKDFSCRAGSTMNPKKKCTLW